MKPRLRKARIRTFSPWGEVIVSHILHWYWECEGDHGIAQHSTPEKAWLEYLKLGEVTIWSENRELERGK